MSPQGNRGRLPVASHRRRQVAKHNIIQDFVSADDGIFFVFRQAIYTNLPTWSIVADQYWSRFLRKIEFESLDR